MVPAIPVVTGLAAVFSVAAAVVSFLSGGISAPAFAVATLAAAAGFAAFTVAGLLLRGFVRKKEMGEGAAGERSALMLDATPLSCFMVRCAVGADDSSAIEAIDCNLAALDLFGFSSKADALANFDNLFQRPTPDTPISDIVFDVTSKALEHGYHRFEFTHLHTDGTHIPCEVTLVRVTYRGEPVLACYQNDLRQIKAAMATERESHEMTRKFLDSAPFFVEIWDKNLNLVECNKTALRMFDLCDGDEYLKIFRELSPKYQPCGTLSSEKIIEVVGACLRDGHSHTEWMHIAPDGSPLPVDAVYVRLKRGDEDIVVGYNQDLRPIRAALEKEMEAEQRAKVLIDASPIVCFLLDENRQAIDCNRAAWDLFVKDANRAIPTTYPQEESLQSCLNGKECTANCGQPNCRVRTFLLGNYRRIFPDYEYDPDSVEEFLLRCCEEAVETGIKQVEYAAMTLYGADIPCEITIVPVEYQQGRVFAVYMRDLREEKRRAAAEEESRAKTRFLARMSHEVRTPMNSVMGIAEIQLQRGGHPQETEEAFLRIYNSSKLLLGIINDILDLSKVEAGRMEIIPAVYETASLIADTMQLNLMYIGSKKIKFDLTVDEMLPLYLVGDELRIKQILNNLLSNAFKYTNEGEVILSFRAEDLPGTDKVSLCINVSDTGQGMTAEQINKLFDIEFTRFNVESNRAIEGSGLGMSITHSLLKMMGGEISVESEPGVGSTFNVRIPQKKKGGQVLGKEAAKSLLNLEATQKYLKGISSLKHEPMPYGRVLVVDDVESNLYVVRGFLSPYRLEAETVNNAAESIERVKAGEIYDIIFMDHMMPEMDGMEATKIMRGLGYTAPIVALTANATQGAAQMFMSNGFSGFVSKPIDPARLDAYLMNFIHDKQPAEVIEAAKARYPDDDAGDSKAVSQRLAESFVMDAEKSLAVLTEVLDAATRQEIGSGEFKAFTIQAHAMKSALYNIGRTELSGVADILEKAGRYGDAATLKERTQELLNGIEEAVRELSSEKREGGVTGTDEDADFTSGRLLEVAAACEAYDKKGARKLLNALKERQLSGKTAALLDNIESRLLLGEFEEASALARQPAEAADTD